jgi:hypothetical protein
MLCIRCGESEVEVEHVFMVSHDHDPDLDETIDAALRRQGIEGVDGLGQLCERCWEVANAAINAGGHIYFATRRDVVERHWEANLSRPMTPAERDGMNAYFDGVGDEGASSST